MRGTGSITAGQGLLLVLLVQTVCLGRVAGLYHTSNEVLHWFSHWAAKHPSLMRFHELQEHHTKTRLPIATITSAADVQPAKAKPVVLFVFGEHAREVITVEVAMWLARMLGDSSSAVFTWPELGAALQRAGSLNISSSTASSTASSTSSTPGNTADSSTLGSGTSSSSGSSTGGDSGSTDSSSGSSSSGQEQPWAGAVRGWIADVLDKLEVQIIPIEAVDSRRQVEDGNLCVRKTSRNVDLNRNWPFAWQRTPQGDEQYGGPGPFSEPQSRLVKRVVNGSVGRLLGYVNVHSGEWALYTPWDSKQAYGTGMPADMNDLVQKVGHLCNCKAGPAGAVSGYLAFGSSMDYLYVHHKVPYPLTVEVYGGGDIGKLAPGETNKALSEFELIERPKPLGVTSPSPPLHKRALQQQQQQQRLHPWELRMLHKQQQVTHIAQPQGQQQQQQQQQLKAAGGFIRRLQQLAAGDGSGFTWAAHLPQLRQHALLQLTQQQLQQQQQQSSQPTGDAIMDLVAKANPEQEGCFKAFNPHTEEAYRRVVADWLAAFLVMLKHMSESEAMKNMTAANSAVGSSSTNSSAVSSIG